jgi:hypothetical protein
MIKPPLPPHVNTLPQPIDDRWVDSRAAGEYLGLKPSSLARLRMNGKGPKFSATLSRDPRYLLSDCRAWLEANLVNNSAEAKDKRRLAQQRLRTP